MIIMIKVCVKASCKKDLFRLLAQSFSPETWGKVGVLACPEKGPSASLDKRGQGDVGQRVQGCGVP